MHANLTRLVGRVPLLARVPLVPGITTTAANLAALAEFVAGLGLRELALLPYNPLWLPKRRALGLEMPYTQDRWMSEDDLRACARLVAERGGSVTAPSTAASPDISLVDVREGVATVGNVVQGRVRVTTPRPDADRGLARPPAVPRAARGPGAARR